MNFITNFITTRKQTNKLGIWIPESTLPHPAVVKNGNYSILITNSSFAIKM